MSASIHDTIAFMKAIRQGYTTNELLQPILEKQDRQIDEKVQTTAVALIEKDQTIQTMTTSRLAQLSACKAFKLRQEQIEGCRKQIGELQTICKRLQATSDDMNKNLHSRQHNVEKLTKDLESLRMLLQRIPSRYKQPLLQLGSSACEVVSGMVQN